MDFLDITFTTHWAHDWLVSKNFPEWSVEALTILIDFVGLFIVAIIADWVSRKIFLGIISKVVAKSKTQWDDYFYKQKVFKTLAHLIPAIIVRYTVDNILYDFPAVFPVLVTIVDIYIIVLIVMVLSKSLKALENLMVNDPKLANSPLRTISQVTRILIFFVAVVFVVSLLTGIKAGTILGVMAGTSAILILIFQDTINGILANLQITMYDLLRVGDWVTLDKYGADGDVVSIDLTTVKISNFDKTISSVPARAFVNDSFINWRGMKEAKSRRIKRNVLIDISSIKFCTENDIAAFAEIGLVKDYVLNKQTEINNYNQRHNLTSPTKLNGRVQSNIGVYRNYILNYLEKHPNIDTNFTIMVRQLQPTPEGVPLEVYCFANTTVWTKYELIQADIFDHLYAATGLFNLRLYQSPAGSDFRYLKSN